MFGTAKEIIEKLDNYPEDEPLLMVMWQREDCHDANVGVNWDVISDTTDSMFPKEGCYAENH